MPWLIAHHVIIGYTGIHAFTLYLEIQFHNIWANVSLGIQHGVIEISQIHTVTLQLFLAQVDYNLGRLTGCGKHIFAHLHILVVSDGLQFTLFVSHIPSQFRSLGLRRQLLLAQALAIEE